jgi:hypothetical protein
MKKLLLILLCLPLLGWTQGQVNCSLLDVTDVVINNTNMTIDIAVYNGDTMDAHYPFISYTIDDIGDTIQNGNINWFVMPAYPLSIYFTYTNLTGSNPGDYTCILTYNISPTNISDITGNKRNLVKITDMLGRDTKGANNQPLFYIYDDGTVEKKITLE